MIKPGKPPLCRDVLHVACCVLHVHITLACARVPNPDPDCGQDTPKAWVAMPPATRILVPSRLGRNNVGPSVEVLPLNNI